MTTPIPLKLKYRVPHKSRYKGTYGGNNNPARPHRTLTAQEIALHAAQPKKIMVLLPSGKLRMMTVG